MRWNPSLAFVALWSLACAVSSAGDRLLVVSDDSADQDKYSTLWKDLKGRGFKVTFETPKSDSLALAKLGVREYDHLMILPPKSKGLGPALAPKLLLEFVNMEGNVLLGLSSESSIPSGISSLLLELDIAVPTEKGTVTVDHFHHDAAAAGDRHDVLLLPQPTPKRADVKNLFGGDGLVAFPHAVAQTLGDATPLLNSVLRAPSTAYTYNTKDDGETVEDPFATGEQISLVTAMQARNSARFTVFGSTDALTDKWFAAKVKDAAGNKVATANRDFARQVTQWTFKETGVLKVGRIQHYLNEPAEDGSLQKASLSNPKIYRVKNDVTFNIELSEYQVDRYAPPALPAADELQLEFTMLSPYHRLTLQEASKTANSTIYTASFTTPDQHGIFSFRVNYKRPYMTSLEVKEEVTVRHFAHDEFARSWTISAGWTWIAGIWVTVAGWLAFVAVWLWSEPVRSAATAKKTQ